ncbi:hypothetical protein ACHAQH_000582 [Verticillium albo-atrum]
MANHRHFDHRPIQTSAVLVLGSSRTKTSPPPSPPSPPEELCEPLESLSLPASGDEQAEEERQKTSTRLRAAVHVLNTEAQALKAVTRLYETDPIARDGFNRTVGAIARHGDGRGKVVITGVGKSGHIANKLAATFNSLSIPTVFLNPLDALHGDLGIVGQQDTLLFITFSGKTSELMGLIPHLHRSSTLVILTGHTRSDTCDLIQARPGTILLPAPVHESEISSFGVSAPTTSTTVALAVGDAIAIAAAEELHPSVAGVFARNHPGGAIGAAFRQKPGTIKEIAVVWSEIPDVVDHDSVGADVLRAGFDSATKWVRNGDYVASPSRIRRLCGSGSEDLSRRLDKIPGLMVPRHEMLSISAGTSVRRALEFVRNVRGMGVTADEENDTTCNADSVLAVLEMGEIVGVVEVGDLLGGSDVW